MNANRSVLAILLVGTLQLVALVALDVLSKGTVERVFGFSQVLTMYWSLVSLSIYFLMVPLGIIHVFMNTKLTIGARFAWSLGFVIAACLVIPVYCVFYWGRSTSGNSSAASMSGM